jgi:hypothetical protein
MAASSAELAPPPVAARAAIGRDTVHEERATTLRLVRAAAIPAAVAATVFGLAFSNGTYGVTARDSVAVAVWWFIALAVGTGAIPVSRIPRPALAGGAALAGLAALSGASIAWSASAEGAFTEANRVLLYLGIFTLVVLGAQRATAARWVDGLAIGIAALGVLALVVRLFPHLIPSAESSSLFPGDPRPSYPVGYWNGLAALVALGFAPLLRVAYGARRPALRALAIAPIPALAALIYLTSSRGGALTAAVACAAFVALTSERLQAALTLAVAGFGSALAIAVLHGRHFIVDGPVSDPQAASQGRSAALLILVVCLAVAVAHSFVSRIRLRAPRLGEGTAFLVGTAVVVAVTIGIVGSNPNARFDSFKKPPAAFTGTSYTSSHFKSDASSGRWQFWQAAVHEFDAKPLSGGGAGSYGAYWAKHGNISYFVKDAHSLYLQTLGELGIGGLLLLLGFFGAALVVARRRLRATRGAERATVAAAAAVAIAFAVSVGIDWMWQLTVVGVVGVGALALLTGPATEFAGSEPPARRKSSMLARGGAVVLSLTVIAALAIPLLAQTDVRASQHAATRGDARAALARAKDARDWQPWAASTQLQVALAQKDLRQFAAARGSIAKAIKADPSDWRLYVVAADIDNASGHSLAAQANLRRAKSLSPRTPLLASVK